VIGKALYTLLNVQSITDLTTDISPSVATPEAVFPYIVFNESGSPENDKDGYRVYNHNVQIDIYASRDRDGNGGIEQANTISELIEGIFYMYRGIVAEVDIRGCVLTEKQVIYDSMSQANRIILEFDIREYKAPAPTGIGYMAIGSTFIVA
tara:strand:+ start:10445 stop:10897 length:453 start_codon:yes stop_codon:yes gene_type:complete